MSVALLLRVMCNGEIDVLHLVVDSCCTVDTVGEQYDKHVRVSVYTSVGKSE